ncbi:unnamed protein product [Brugia timori]|uniref:Secreted protein n=1 Tax=Brugia timori TaxID=42155 RepID=A0A0R3QV07_9BILA|nr:unnamed protein product [Brugia timori]
MYSLLILLLPFVLLPPTDKCDSSAHKLALFALSDGSNDALERLKCSTEHYDIDFRYRRLKLRFFIFKPIEFLNYLMLLRKKAILFVSLTPAALVVHSLHQTRCKHNDIIE